MWVRYGLRLMTKIRRKMRERLLTYTDKLLLRERALIESVNDQLKNNCQIEHSRHCSLFTFLVHLLVRTCRECGNAGR